MTLIPLMFLWIIQLKMCFWKTMVNYLELYCTILS